MNLILIELINRIIITICASAIFVSILINFFESKYSPKVKKEKKSIVETGSMITFFIIFYLVMRFNVGTFSIRNETVRVLLIFIGWIVILAGTYFNISGRIALGKNWANQIKIYQKHKLVNKGVYLIVRHPLYASLIWMFYAGTIIYLNGLAFLLNTLIFVPFMYYRAKQEEYLLTKEFKEYKKYTKRTGMFFPKIRWNK